jgi:hypothetical protein
MRDHVVLEDVPEWDVTVAQFHHPALRKVVSMDNFVRRVGRISAGY